MDSCISLTPNTLQIRGKPVLILCASLFYFRIPRAHWRERMNQLKEYGYNAIDVYFPWNYHETEEGFWDFEGEKDAAAFLQEASDAGLWVVARPGPYICSEWDGGALPAYLYTKPNLVLREANAEFLRYTAAWYDRILPIVKAFQPEQGGTVLCVQLDNELDFYDCGDPESYMGALRDMALAHGITVPLIACAGQGGVKEASGLAEGVVPTCNFYPNDRDPGFEGKVIPYKELLEGMGHPLLVTETNRSHYLLRRLLSCGAKLLGPYLQVSGTDFGFTNATNNWGRPLAFMTSDYDFGGMISPEGHVRVEAYEGRMLSRLIDVYGEALSRARPAATTLPVAEKLIEGQASLRSLELDGGGSLLFATNLTDREVEVELSMDSELDQDQDLGTGAEVYLPEGRSLALPLHIPLQLWGQEGELVYSTLELFHAVVSPTGATLFFHTEGKGELALCLRTDDWIIHSQGADMRRAGDRIIFRFDAADGGRVHIRRSDERVLEIIVLQRDAALHLEIQDDGNGFRVTEPIRYPSEPAALPVPWSLHPVAASIPMVTEEHSVDPLKARFLEEYGIYRGYAWYSAEFQPPAGRGCKGLLVQQGSDVISLYADDAYIRTVVPGGGSCFIGVEKEHGPARITARTEIWGHTNFDDIRLPALRLRSCKGLRGLVSVSKVTDLTDHWRLERISAGLAKPEASDTAQVAQDDRFQPIVGLGGWMSPGQPARELYRKSFLAMAGADTQVLHLEGLQASAHLYVNEKDAGVISAFDPYVDITAYVQPGQMVHLTMYVEKRLDIPVGKVMLYEGTAAVNYRIHAMEEAQLAVLVPVSSDSGISVKLPLQMEPGSMAWLHGSLDDSGSGRGWRMRVAGTALKLTVLLNGRIVGRLWTPDSKSRPRFSGGDPESVYLPGPWLTDGSARISILLEAVEPDQASTLQSLAFVPV